MDPWIGESVGCMVEWKDELVGWSVVRGLSDEKVVHEWVNG